MYPLETAQGMTSQIGQLVGPSGHVAFTSWPRRNVRSGLLLDRLTARAWTMVKTVFPLEHGNSTVLLRPEAQADGSLKLISSGRRFGDPGFYRIIEAGPGRLRGWYVRGVCRCSACTTTSHRSGAQGRA